MSALSYHAGPVWPCTGGSTRTSAAHRRESICAHSQDDSGVANGKVKAKPTGQSVRSIPTESVNDRVEQGAPSGSC